MSAFECTATTSAPSGQTPWAKCRNAPSIDGININGINCTNPLDYTNWAYVHNLPKGPNDPSIVIANKGDPYLGMVDLDCESNYNVPCYQSANVDTCIPYLQYSYDGCNPNDVCPSPSEGCPFSSVPYGAGTYGECHYAGGYHHWFVRDWDTEMRNGPTVGAVPINIMRCCSMDPSTPNRTQQCPPDVWAHSSKCSQAMPDGCINLPEMAASSPCLQDPNSDYCKYYTEVNGFCTGYLQQLYATQNYEDRQLANATVLQMLDAWKNSLGGQKPQETDLMTAFFVNWCSKNPGLCDAELSEICAPLEREDLMSPAVIADANIYLPKLCACFMSPDTYLLPGIIPKECDVVCANNLANGGVPLTQYQYNPTTGSGTVQPATCKQSNCVIDDVALTFMNTNIGNISLGQSCAGCSGGVCNCIIDNATGVAIGSNIGGMIINNCNTCVYNNELVPCSLKESFEPEKMYTTNHKRYHSTTLDVVLLAIVGFVIIFLLCYNR